MSENAPSEWLLVPRRGFLHLQKERSASAGNCQSYIGRLSQVLGHAQAHVVHECNDV